MTKKAVIVASGGMDSAAAAWLYKAKGYDIHLVGFDYGQKHVKELSCLMAYAQDLNAKVDIIDLKQITVLLGRNSLTADADVPDGHYREETMRKTVVPNRNAMMLNIAVAIAQGEEAEVAVIGVHGGDHFIYPDCRPPFVLASMGAIEAATEGKVRLEAPFLYKSKADIAEIGNALFVPFEKTWSCYKGGSVHCGTCGTCFERKEAFHVARVPDTTKYAIEGFEWYKGEHKVEEPKPQQREEHGLPVGGELEV